MRRRPGRSVPGSPRRARRGEARVRAGCRGHPRPYAPGRTSPRPTRWPSRWRPAPPAWFRPSSVSPFSSCERSSGVPELVRLALEVLDAAAHEERLLRVAVELTGGEALERVDRLLHRHERAGDAGELLGDEGVLR